MWEYYNPVNVIFGSEKFNEIEHIISNRKYILVTHPDDNFDTYREFFNNLSNKPLEIFDDVQPNPDYQDLISAGEKFSKIESQIDTVVALGGGSVMDTAKLLAAFKGENKYLNDFVRNKKSAYVQDPKKIIAIPTTSGTSSELTCWATVWDKEYKSKFSLADKSLYPEISVIDPKLMINKPKNLTISTGLDALSHSLESIWNVNSNPISTFHGIAGAQTVIDTLPKLVNDLKNIELRTLMAKACVHAGLAFSNTKTAIAHNISYPITINFNVPHGIACSFTLPTIMRSLIGQDEKTEKSLEKIYNVDLIESSKRLCETLRILEAPLNLNEIGIPKIEWDKYVEDAFQGERGKNFIGNKISFDKACSEMNFF